MNLLRIIKSGSIKKSAIFIALVAVTTIILYTDCLDLKNKAFVYGFQRDSESLVIGKMLADKYRLTPSKFNLGRFTSGEFVYTIDKILEAYKFISPQDFYITDVNWVNGISRYWAGFFDFNTDSNIQKYKVGRTVRLSESDSRVIESVESDSTYIHVHLSGNLLNPKILGYPNQFKVLENGQSVQDFKFTPYSSQYGLQGRAFSFIYNKLNIDKIGILRLLNIVLLSIVLCSLCMLISREYDIFLASIFYIVFIMSPWITAFSGNLFWVPFTWFLPALFSLLLLRNTKLYYLYLPLIYLSVFIKSLCGYEYLSTILVFAILFWVVEFFINTKKQRRKTFIFMTSVGLLCVLGFVSALLIHASMLNSNVVLGLKHIWHEDVLRRTYANVSDFPAVFKDSLQASPYETVQKYFHWNTDIVYGISGKYFPRIFLVTFIILIFNSYKRLKNSKRDWLLCVVSLMCPFSWFILAKAHSYIHTHMNFVLYYFGFIQIMFYIIIKFVLRDLPKVTSHLIKKSNDI